MWSDESRSDLDFLEYRVYYSSSLSSGYQLTGTTTLTGFVAGNVATGIRYDFIVRGADTIQESINSPVASGTPTTVAIPNPTPVNCGGPNPPDNCAASGGPPDGIFSSVLPTQTLIVDLGAGNGVLDGPGYDFVYYEREADPLPSGYILMDLVIVELSLDGTTWQTPFAWNPGSENLAQNSNIWLFASDDSSIAACLVLPLYAGSAANEIIYMTAGGPGGICPAWRGLWGTTPYQTGVAIDIAGIPPPVGEGYRYIRITAPGPEPAEVDAIERLN